MKTVEFPAEERGHADHGWLNANHYFSFAGWYDPERVHYGALRVVNDDRIAAGQGFGTHPHDNMEIITIPVKGKLEHKDSMGNGSVITAGEVQVMSAGSGIYHSEFNPSEEEATELFQIWIFPANKGIEPVYGQASYSPADYENKVFAIVGPNGGKEKLQINQNAWISLAGVSEGKELSYSLNDPENGVFSILVSGSVQIADHTLGSKDALGISETQEFMLSAKEDSFLIFIEVPMTF